MNNWLHQLSPDGRRPFDPLRGAVPRRGDLVFWNNWDHVALAVGSKDRMGRHEVISFWAPLPLMFSGIPAQIKRTTIEELTAIANDPKYNVSGPASVTYGRGPW